MKRYHWFHKTATMVSLIGTLFVWSCSEAPTPGPISPIHSDNASKHGAGREAKGQIRPLNRLDENAANALAKGAYAKPKAIQHLQDLLDELQYIVEAKSGTPAVDKIDDAVAKAETAKNALNKMPSDDATALENLASARGILQAAIWEKSLNAIQGTQFIAEIVVVEGIIKWGVKSHDCRGAVKYLWMKNAEGGLIAHCGHRVIVPKHALPKDAMLSIKIDASSFITVDFGPDGKFNSNVAVGISYRDADLTGVNLNGLILAWFDEAFDQWIDLGGKVDSANQIVWSQTDHFTQYTISTK